MLISVRFLEKNILLQSKLEHVMSIGEYLAILWPKYNTFKDFITFLIEEAMWTEETNEEEPACYYELNDDSEVMLVFNQKNSIGLKQFRDEIYETTTNAY